jgi:ABC-2 type transport system permease protein
VTYVMEGLRSLILDDLDWGKIAAGYGVVVALVIVAVALNVRVVNHYD